MPPLPTLKDIVTLPQRPSVLLISVIFQEYNPLLIVFKFFHFSLLFRALHFAVVVVVGGCDGGRELAPVVSYPCDRGAQAQSYT